MSTRPQIFPQPDFIPPFAHGERLAALRVAITGTRGVLGGLLKRRLGGLGIGAQEFPGDITDPPAVEAWLAAAAPDLVFHFAAIVPLDRVAADRARAFEVNALGAFHLCRAAARLDKAPWLFLASTSHVYAARRPGAAAGGAAAAPASVYGRSKLAGETLCREFLEACGRPYCIGRIFSFSHASQREPFLVPRLERLIGDAADGTAIRVTNPRSVRDIVDAETVIDAALHLAVRRFQGTLDIGSGRGLRVEDIARHLIARRRRDLRVEGDEKEAPDELVADVTLLRQALEQP